MSNLNRRFWNNFCNLVYLFLPTSECCDTHSRPVLGRLSQGDGCYQRGVLWLPERGKEGGGGYCPQACGSCHTPIATQECWLDKGHNSILQQHKRGIVSIQARTHARIRRYYNNAHTKTILEQSMPKECTSMPNTHSSTRFPHHATPRRTSPSQAENGQSDPGTMSEGVREEVWKFSCGGECVCGVLLCLWFKASSHKHLLKSNLKRSVRKLKEPDVHKFNSYTWKSWASSNNWLTFW